MYKTRQETQAQNNLNLTDEFKMVRSGVLDE